MFYCKCAALFRAASVAHGDIVQRHLYVTAPVTDAGRDVSVQSARGARRKRLRKIEGKVGRPAWLQQWILERGVR